LDALRRTDRLCDDCLSEVTGVTPRQAINAKCRQLQAAKQLLRPKEDCARCHAAKIVNRLMVAREAAHASAAHRPSTRWSNDTSYRASERPAIAPRRLSDIEASKTTCFLVSCVGQKQGVPAKARDLYTSDWFKKARRFVEDRDGSWFILSAEHGLLHPDTVVAPYNKTLNNMTIAERRTWANRVIEQMKAGLPLAREIVVLAGSKYRQLLIDYLTTRAKVIAPLEGLGIGEQLSWFASQAVRK
jgi:hypothetical protein